MPSLCPYTLILSDSWLLVAMLLERRAAADACLLPIQKAFNGGRPVAASGAQTASFKGYIECPNQYTPHQRETETDRCSLHWCNQLLLAIVEHQYLTSRLYLMVILIILRIIIYWPMYQYKTLGYPLKTSDAIICSVLCFL